jgi:ribosomal protein S18 acetylase RimI-like enzyme
MGLAPAQFRWAVLADAHSLARVQVQSWQTAYADLLPAPFLANLSIPERQAIWQKSIAQNHPRILLAEVENVIVGFCALAPSRDPDATPSTGEIWALYLQPTHWNQGIGRALWAATQQELRALGMSEVTLWVIPQNLRGVNFYRAAGCVEEPESLKTFLLGGVEVQEVRYRKRLK